jgi:hypothetical protein
MEDYYIGYYNYFLNTLMDYFIYYKQNNIFVANRKPE